MKHFGITLGGIAILFVGVFLGTLVAQTEPTVRIGSVSLVLGMPEKDAMERLAGSFDLRQPVQQPGNSSWQVWPKTPGSPPLANILFERGVLRYIRLYWLNNDQREGAPAANAIYGILAKGLQKGRWQKCDVLVDANQTPGGEFKNVHILCGDSSVEISVSRTKLGEDVTVDEVYQSRK